MASRQASATVTVLFTDLVGSTELMGRLGDTGFDRLRGEHFDQVRGALSGHGGQEIKTTGDGLLATFTSAVEALAAAVAIEQATDRHARSTGLPVAVRVGLSIGEVAFEDGDVFGTPVVEAARLVAAARPGQILTAASVRMLAGSRAGAHFSEIETVHLKGLAEPLPVCEVAWEPLPAAIPLPSLVSRVGRIFVGRDDVLAQLAQRWKEAVAGERRVALLAGEPGIGKTRLASALAHRCHDEEAVVLAGRCDEDLGVPYQPFVEALRHYGVHAAEPRLGRHGGELVRLVPELGEAAAGLPPPIRSDPETERYRLFDAVAAWLADASADAPVVLVLDDLQWAAKPTLLLLRHVLRSPEPMRLLVVATYRDTDLGRAHPLSGFLADLRKEPGVERVPLSGLDVPGVAAFLTEAAGHELDEAGGELARVIWWETEGLPFFVAEVVRHLTETGALALRDGRWVVTAPVDQLGIPEGVRDVVGRRLSRLTADANRVLACAAVAGLEFEPAVVRMAGSFAEDMVFSALEDAVAARLLAEAPGPVPRNRFSHALVRATLYDELTAARRVTLHRKVAEAIERLHAGNLDDHLPALTHHWARAADPAAETTKAVDYATRAGDRALTQLAHDEAAAYYRQALDLLAVAGVPPNDRRRIELLISLGQAQLRAGDPDHRATLLDAAALAAQAGAIEALGRAALANYRGIHSSSRTVDADRVAVLERALQTLPEPDSAMRARLLATLASELAFSSQHAYRRRLGEEALAMARRLGDPATLARVLATRVPALVISAERAAEMAELASLASRIGDPALVFWAKGLGGIMALTVGDLRAFTLGVDEAVRIADELGQPIMRWFATLPQVMACRIAGRLDDAERLAAQAVEIGEAAGLSDARFIYEHSGLFWIRHDQGRLAELVDGFERLASGSFPPSQAFVNLGVAYGELGRLDEARAVLDRLATDDFAMLGGGYTRVFELTMVAELCAAVGDRPRAETLYRLLAPHRGLIAHRGGAASGAVEHYLALLEATRDRFEEADREFTSAAARHEHLAAPTWLARTRLEWAEMLLAHSEPGNAERAGELLGHALGTARELGLTTIERRATALLG